MTLEEKVGQLFMVHVYGRTPTDPDYVDENRSSGRGARDFAEAVERYHVGGFIYFNRNANISVPLDAAQVQDLSNDLQRIAANQRVPVPLLIATDQEGGLVARVTQPATVFPGAMAVGATRSAGYAGSAAAITGTELGALGINADMAPVVDVNLNPANPVIGVRSFGEDSSLVSELGAAQVRGLQDAGVSATAKHFPGHGDTAVDSHYGLPIITHDRETLERVDLEPFRAAIAARVDAIMTAHIVVPALDPSGLPATLSQPILTGVLRGELGFEGVIITDSLDMSGANVLPPDRVAVEALKAGADVLLNPPDVEVAYRAVLAAFQTGELTHRRLDDSVRRVLRLKHRRLEGRQSVDRRELDRLGAPKHLALAARIADRSITLLKNDGGIVPLRSGTRVLVIGTPAASPAELGAELAGRGRPAEVLVTSPEPTAAEVEAAVARAAAAEAIVVTTSNATAGAAQQRLVHSIRTAGRPVAVAAMGNPYDYAAFPDVAAYLAAYGARSVNTRALARVLVGEVNPTGRLPVTIPGHFPFGAGVSFPNP